MAARAAPDGLDRKAESDLLVDLAPHLEDFLGELFGIAERGSRAPGARTTGWRRSIR